MHVVHVHTCVCRRNLKYINKREYVFGVQNITFCNLFDNKFYKLFDNSLAIYFNQSTARKRGRPTLLPLLALAEYHESRELALASAQHRSLPFACSHGILRGRALACFLVCNHGRSIHGPLTRRHVCGNLTKVQKSSQRGQELTSC